MIPLTKPNITGKEIEYIEDAICIGQLSGNGKYTNLCQNFFTNYYGFNKCFLTNSCTAALEMAALLIDIQPGDEVIIPSFTYVSSANPFIMRGAKIVFADSETKTPNIDASKLPELITKKTKAIVVVHYGGIACNMGEIMNIAEKFNVCIIEDAAHAQGAFYEEKHLGSIGHLSTYSFHRTKNITSGEGGLLIINDDSFLERAELIWEKGTNRNKFLLGEVNKYEWVDIGSSFYPSEITAAFLWGQLQMVEKVNSKRLESWNIYYQKLQNIKEVELPQIPKYARHNAHLFYLKISNKKLRDQLILKLKKNNINASFHYLALHQSPFWKEKKIDKLINAEQWEDHIIRLPLYYDLSLDEIRYIVDTIKQVMK